MKNEFQSNSELLSLGQLDPKQEFDIFLNKIQNKLKTDKENKTYVSLDKFKDLLTNLNNVNIYNMHAAQNNE